MVPSYDLKTKKVHDYYIRGYWNLSVASFWEVFGSFWQIFGRFLEGFWNIFFGEAFGGKNNFKNIKHIWNFIVQNMFLNFVRFYRNLRFLARPGTPKNNWWSIITPPEGAHTGPRTAVNGLFVLVLLFNLLCRLLKVFNDFWQVFFKFSREVPPGNNYKQIWKPI